MERKGIKWRTLQSSWSAYTWLLSFLAYPPQEGTNWNQALNEAKNFPPHHTNLPTPREMFSLSFATSFPVPSCRYDWNELLKMYGQHSLLWLTKANWILNFVYEFSTPRNVFTFFCHKFSCTPCRHDWKEVLEMQGQHSLPWFTKAQWILNFVYDEANFH